MKPRRTLATTASHGAMPRAERFDGIRRSKRSWNNLRKDDELWFEHGTCLVHLYAPGTSRRGPSLKIPFNTLEDSKHSSHLFGERLFRPDPSTPTASSEDDNSDSGYGASPVDRASRVCELYLPAPHELTRREAFQYHVGTRNYFAFLLNKPLVGEHLGDALSNLATRIEEWQPNAVGSTKFLDYCQDQGYLDFAENVECAIAGLILADRARIPSIWLDAFTHCVGMQQRLKLVEEAEYLNYTTQALIDHAALKMDLHIRQATKSIGLFLEEELGPEHIGLSRPMRDHLDRFRSVLHSFYVNEAGYFPPDEDDAWDKSLWRNMHDDFQCLYDYLADTQSSTNRAANRGLNGGICVQQNLEAFDQQQGYEPLPHPLPLEFEAPLQRRESELQRGFRSLKLRSAPSMQPKLKTSRAAGNLTDPAVADNRLVREYIHFESSKLQEKVSASEARKIRWLIVYATLQTLRSITGAPAEVRDPSTPSYPLCLVDSARPSWYLEKMERQGQSDREFPSRPSSRSELVRNTMESERVSLHPDCEADCAEDFFAMHRFSRVDSDTGDHMEGSPTRMTPQLSRTASIRSSVNSLHNTIVESLSRRASYSMKRKSSFQQRPKMTSCDEEQPDLHISTSFLERNGAEQDTVESNDEYGSLNPPGELEAPFDTTFVPNIEPDQLRMPDTIVVAPLRTVLSTSLFPAGHVRTNVPPGLKLALDRFAPPTQPMSPISDSAASPSTQSGTSSQDYNSKPSSYFDGADSPRTSVSSSDSFVRVKNNDNADKPAIRLRLVDDDDGAIGRPLTYQPTTIIDGDALHEGWYVPRGADRMQSRAMSADSVTSAVSAASSCYPDDSQQAADIDEVESRGRKMLRRMQAFGIVDANISLPNTPFRTPEERT